MARPQYSSPWPDARRAQLTLADHTLVHPPIPNLGPDLHPPPDPEPNPNPLLIPWPYRDPNPNPNPPPYPKPNPAPSPAPNQACRAARRGDARDHAITRGGTPSPHP